MTPGERLRYAEDRRRRALAAVQDAIAELDEAAMALHYARFIETAASAVCPTCSAPAGSYCGIWRTVRGEFVTRGVWALDDVLHALFLHPARSTTPEALFAASLP